MYLCRICCCIISHATVIFIMLQQVLTVPTVDNKSTELQQVVAKPRPIPSHSFSNRSTDALHSLWKEEWGPFPDDPSDPVTIIYYKYAIGSKGMTASEFETLLNCSFGSSSCNKDYPDLINSTESPYSYLSDCQINSALSPEKCDIINKCNNGQELMSLFYEDNKIMNETQFRNLLPIVFFQMQSQICKDQNFHQEEVVINKKPSSAEVWGYGILFVTLISGLSLAGVSVLPLMAKEFYQKLLTVLIGLAVGSLAASSAFHLIPQAFGMINPSDGNHEYLFISLWILIGIYLFFMIERILKIIVIAKKQASENFPNSLSSQTFVQDMTKCGRKENCQEAYGVNPVCTNKIRSRRESSDSNCENSCLNTTSNNTRDNSNSFCTANNVELIYASQEQAIKASFGHEQRPAKCHDHEIKFQQGKDSVIKTVAWMIIFGDGFHNFIDGVSIGAAFQQSILTGISISLAVMCEELPHELGDFAVLLNSGMGMKQALFYNFLSASTCYIGMAVGIVIGEFTQNSTYVFALAAGMFLYISLVDMLPEMNETGNTAAAKGLPDVIKVLFLQTFGMALGVGSLFFLAYYQDRITLGM